MNRSREEKYNEGTRKNNKKEKVKIERLSTSTRTSLEDREDC